MTNEEYIQKPYDPTPANHATVVLNQVTADEQTQKLMQKERLEHLEQQIPPLEDQIYEVKSKLQAARSLDAILGEKKQRQMTEIEQRLRPLDEGYVTSVPKDIAEMRAHLSHMVALVIAQERVLGRLRRFGKCEEAWRSEEFQKAEELVAQLKEVQRQKLEVAGVAWESVNDHNEMSSQLQAMNSQERAFLKSGEQLRAQITQLNSQNERLTKELKVLESSWAVISRNTIEQRTLLDKQRRMLSKDRTNLEQKVILWESKANELGKRLDAFDTIGEIKEGLRLLVHRTDWSDISWDEKAVTTIEFRKPFEKNRDAQEDVSEFMRDIIINDNQFIFTTERKKFRIEKRGPIDIGGFRSVFLMHNGTRECIGKIFHLRRGPERDNDCATRTVKSGLLANEVAWAYTKVLQKSLDDNGMNEKWIFKYITASLIFNYDDPYESSSRAPDGTLKKTVMMVESSLNTDNLKFEKFTSPFGEIQQLPDMVRDETSLVIDTLSHWSYMASNRRFMVVDLQGAYDRVTHTFLLTDPGIHTEDEDFWNALNHDCDGNFKRAGLEGYKKVHICNKYCEILDIENSW